MRKLDRRRFLCSSKSIIALPLLEYLQTSAQAQTAGTKRLLFCYIPNGANWQPSGTGRLELPEVLTPLSSMRDYITVVSGLNLPSARDGRSGDHARASGAFLTGVTGQFPGPGVATSMDITLGQTLSAGLPYNSLYFGGDSLAGSDNGYSPSYQGNFSWASATAANSKETDPRAIFDRLFGGGAVRSLSSSLGSSGTVSRRFALAAQDERLALRQSVLDYVLSEAQDLSKRLGATDNQKLDEYLTSVRELEQRIMAAPASGASGDTVTSGGAPLGTSPAAGAAQCSNPNAPTGGGSYEGRIAQLYELMAHAFACDLTRVGAFMLASEASNQSYSFAGVTGGHHEISHDDSAAGRTQLAGIVKWHMGQLNAFLTKIQELGILDSTLVLFGGGLGNGARHDHENIPVLVAGRVDGLVEGGRHIAGQGAPLANLQLSLAQAAGVNISRIGDSTGSLSLV